MSISYRVMILNFACCNQLHFRVNKEIDSMLGKYLLKNQCWICLIFGRFLGSYMYFPTGNFQNSCAFLYLDQSMAVNARDN